MSVEQAWDTTFGSWVSFISSSKRGKWGERQFSMNGYSVKKEEGAKEKGLLKNQPHKRKMGRQNPIQGKAEVRKR